MRAVAILNGTARRVRAWAARLESALPGAVRVTSSLEHAREVLRAELTRGRDLVVFGGGDGTVVMGLAIVAETCRGLGRPEPAIGVLRLGTGNALADAVGASRDPGADLVRLGRGDGAWHAQPLIEVMGLRVPFVGVGVDAQLLEDRASVGRLVDRIPVARRLVGNAARYALAVPLRSVPRFALSERALATVTNLGAPALEVARGGLTGRAVPRGAVLWQGDVTLVAGATIPSFGFGLKMFPFANARGDRFQLRCGDPGLLGILRGAPAAFRGRYFSAAVRDFLCDRVQIELDREAAVEAGGELLGRHRSFALRLGRPATFASLAEIGTRGDTRD